MKRFLARLTVVSLVFGALASLMQTQAQEPLPYEAAFEIDDGFRMGDVDGQRGFSVVRGQAQVVPDEGVEGSDSLKLLPSRPFGIVQLSIDAGLDDAGSPDRVVHTDFMVRPGAVEAAEGDQFADVEGSLTGFFKIDDLGELHIYDGGDADAAGQWLPSGVRFELDEAGQAVNWIRLSFRQDFERGLWDVAINGEIFRANLAMAEQAQTLEKIEFIGQSRQPLYVDNVRVSREATAFADADRDGMPDFWEVEQGLTEEDGRDGDKDGDGLTNIEELVLQTKAHEADTDGDGSNDGDEYASGTDPRVGVDAPEEAALSWPGAGGLSLNVSPYGSGYHMLTVSWSSYTEWKIWVYNSWDYPYVYRYMTGESIGQGSSNWTGGTDYVISATGNVAFIYLWAKNHMSGGTENSVLFKVNSGSGGSVLSSGSSLGGGNLGSEEAAEEALDDYCDFCADYMSDSDCDQINVGSIKFSVGVGKTQFGRRSHALVVHEQGITERSFSRESIHLTNPEDLDVGRSIPRPKSDRGFVPISKKTEPLLDWVRTDTRFVKLNDIVGGYEIRKYALDQVSADNEPTGDPYVAMRVYNPDYPLLHADHRRLIMEKAEAGRTSVHEYRYSVDAASGRETWELFEGAPGTHVTQPLRLRRLVIEDPDAANRGDYTETRTVHHWNAQLGELALDSKTRETFRRFPYGARKISRVADPDGEALTVSLQYYDAEESEFPVTGRVKTIQWADGDWEYYVYDEQGRETEIYRPAGNTPLPQGKPEGGVGYESAVIDYDGPGYQLKRTRYLDGHPVKVTYQRWDKNDMQQDRQLVEIEAATVTSGPDDPANHVTVSREEAVTRRPVHRSHPDGSTVDYRYELMGADERSTVERRDRRGVVDSIETTLRHPSGALLERKRVDGATDIVTAHEVVGMEGLDTRFRAVTTVDHVSNQITRRSYNCCGLEWVTQGDGSTTKNEYDVLGRVVAVQSGYKSPLEPGNQLTAVLSAERYHLDGLDRALLTENTLDPGDAPPLAPATERYDLAGRVVESVSTSGVATRSKTVMLPEGGRVELTSLPRSGHDNRHRITARQFRADGRLYCERTYASSEPFGLEPDPRTTVSHRVHQEGIDAKGRYSEVIDIANLFDRRVTRTYLNERGQTREIVHAYGTSLAASEHFEYSQDGQLIRTVDPDGVTTRYGYNEKGRRYVTAIDMKVEPNEPAGHIDYDVDRITRTSTELATDAGGQPIRRTTTERFTESGPVIVSVQEQALDGRSSATIENGRRATRQRVEGDGPGRWSTVVTQADGSHTIQTYENGRLTRNARHGSDGALISWKGQTYDGYGRVSGMTDGRTGTTTFHYDERGRRWKISAPNPATGSSVEGTLDTIIHYDALGRATRTTKPGGGEVHQVFNANGTLHGTHGHHTTDVNYRYNGRGQRTHLITYYGADNQPAETRWSYNPRGQLAFKQDAHGKRAHYTYTPAGKLKTRTWARGVTTTYHYDEDNRHDLRAVDYSDGTPDVHFTYNRLGQKWSVQDAGGITTYSYRPEAPTELRSETSGENLYAEAKTLTYLQDGFGRPGGFQIGTEEDPDQDYALGLGFDNASRLESVHAHGYWFYYAYEPNSTTDRVKTVTAPFVKQTEFTYEHGRDTIVRVTNRVGFNPDREIARFDYTNNAEAQRTARTTSDGDAGNKFEDRFTYDPDTGGVIASERDNGGASYAYAYDKIGNRLSATENGMETRYEANALNQYTVTGDEHPRHDADGNLIAKGDRTYVWDGENRLVAIRERGTLVAEYTYDHQSRRIARKTRDGVDERYLYQGWNLIAVYRPDESEPTETFTWGKDLSGSLHGAGGVGGLLFANMRDHQSDAWIYHYDANGNVTVVTDPKGGGLDRYDYDPFGNLLGAPQLPKNRWRFSTKPADLESGWYYYGNRCYEPIGGRWPCRDPKAESGGTNLYAFVSNDSTNRIDVLGLEPWPITRDGYVNAIDSAINTLSGLGNNSIASGKQQEENNQAPTDYGAYNTTDNGTIKIYGREFGVTVYYSCRLGETSILGETGIIKGYFVGPVIVSSMPSLDLVNQGTYGVTNIPTGYWSQKKYAKPDHRNFSSTRPVSFLHTHLLEVWRLNTSSGQYEQETLPVGLSHADALAVAGTPAAGTPIFAVEVDGNTYFNDPSDIENDHKYKPKLPPSSGYPDL